MFFGGDFTIIVRLGGGTIDHFSNNGFCIFLFRITTFRIVRVEVPGAYRTAGWWGVPCSFGMLFNDECLTNSSFIRFVPNGRCCFFQYAFRFKRRFIVDNILVVPFSIDPAWGPFRRLSLLNCKDITRVFVATWMVCVLVRISFHPTLGYHIQVGDYSILFCYYGLL